MSIDKFSFSRIEHVNVELTCQACGHKNGYDLGKRYINDFECDRLLPETRKHQKIKFECDNCNKHTERTLQINLC